MLRVPDYLVLSLTGAFTLAIGMAAIPAPADARKLGKAAAGAVAVAAGKSSARAATREKSDDTQEAEIAGEAEASGEPQTAGETETVEKASPVAAKSSESERTARIEAAAAHAKAQLAAEKTDASSLMPTSGQTGPAATTTTVCVAGCGYSKPINR